MISSEKEINPMLMHRHAQRHPHQQRDPRLLALRVKPLLAQQAMHLQHALHDRDVILLILALADDLVKIQKHNRPWGGGGRNGPRPAGPGATMSTQVDGLAMGLLRLRRLCHRGHKATNENSQYGDTHSLPASASVETRRGLNPHTVTQRAESVDHDDRLPPEEVLDLVQHYSSFRHSCK